MGRKATWRIHFDSNDELSGCQFLHKLGWFRIILNNLLWLEHFRWRNFDGQRRSRGQGLAQSACGDACCY